MSLPCIVTAPLLTRCPLLPHARQMANVGKPSSLLDTGVVFCGDNLDQLKKLPSASVYLIYIDPLFQLNY